MARSPESDCERDLILKMYGIIYVSKRIRYGTA